MLEKETEKTKTKEFAQPKRLSAVCEEIIVLMAQGLNRTQTARELNKLQISTKEEDEKSIRAHQQRIFYVLKVNTIFGAVSKTITTGSIDRRRFIPQDFDFKSVPELSDRDTAIMQVKLENPDWTIKQIAEHFDSSITEKTVINRLTAIRDKYGAENTVQAATIFLLKTIQTDDFSGDPDASKQRSENKENSVNTSREIFPGEQETRFRYRPSPSEEIACLEIMLEQGTGIVVARKEEMDGQTFFESPFVLAAMPATREEFFAKLVERDQRYAELVKELRTNGFTKMTMNKSPHGFFLIADSMQLNPTAIKIVNKLITKAEHNSQKPIQLSDAVREKLR